MKKLFFLFSFLLFIGSISSCKHEREDVCINEALKRFGMIKFKGQETQCKFFLIAFERSNEFYFTLTSDCVDMIFKVVDCDGKEIDRFWYANFGKNFTNKGIVGIRP